MFNSADSGTYRTGAAFRIVVVAIGVFDLVLRTDAIFMRNGALSTAQFDEGVYTAAAGSLLSGDVPYRDFVFLHPPGVTLLLAPLAGLARALGSWGGLLVAARWLMALVALVNVILIAFVAWRWSGWLGGVVAAVLYASYLPAVDTEGHVMLEPLVTLGVLVSALLWVGSPVRARTDARAVQAGVVAALTALMKLIGGVALLAMLLVERLRAPWRQRFIAAGSAAAVAGLVLLPFAVLAGPSTVLDQAVMTQLRRPGEDITGETIPGIVDRMDHLGSYGPFAVERFGGRAGLVGAALAAVLVVWAWRSGHDTGRFFAVMVAAGSIAILSSPDYYHQYPVPVFAGIAVLAGGAAAHVVQTIGQRISLMRTIAVISIALGLAAGAGDTVDSVIEDARNRIISHPAALIAGAVETDCISADLPEKLLALDRLPPRDRTGDRLVDPFGALMYEALQHADFPTTASALHSKPAQERLRQSLIACPYAVTRGSLESPPARWSDSTRAWFLDRFEAILQNQAGLTLWRRSDDEE